MDKTLTIKIDAALHEKTVKYILKNKFGLSTAIISYLKSTGDGIMLNGKKVFVTHQVCEGDTLAISIHDSRSDIPASNIPLDILYEDEDIIALNKPRCMPTHPSQNHYADTLANGLMHYYSSQNFTFRAITDFETISVSNSLAFVRLNPLTGRTHQLRVHMSHIGTPIYGDDLYGAPQKDEPTRLHCRKISFVHPFTKKEIMIEAPIPDDITELIN